MKEGELRQFIRQKFHTLKNGLERLLTNDLNYFFEQFMYGHRELLIAYANLNGQAISAQSYLKGGLSHGWQPDEGHWKVWNRNLSQASRFVWNGRNELAHLRKNKNVAIGAPWLYLLSSLGIQPGYRVRIANNQDERKNLLMLTHNLANTQKRLDIQAEHYARICNPKETTVCLYWIDFCNPLIHRSFTILGFKVVCAGYPPQFDVGPQSISRPLFLLNLFEIIASHQSYFTDECTTSLFYAASLGLEINLCHDPVGHEFQESWRGNYSASGGVFFASGIDWVRNYFPELESRTQDHKIFSEFAWKELGFESLRKATEVASLPWGLDERIDVNQVLALKMAIVEMKSKIELEKH